jgi:hypothetical protein
MRSRQVVTPAVVRATTAAGAVPALATGRSVTVGFTGRYASSDARPAAFTLNGTACRS